LALRTFEAAVTKEIPFHFFDGAVVERTNVRKRFKIKREILSFLLLATPPPPLPPIFNFLI
jgi:hypothetical protein